MRFFLACQSSRSLFFILVAAAISTGCGGVTVEPTGQTESTGTSSGGGGSSGTAMGGTAGRGGSTSSQGGGGSGACVSAPDEDLDGDGFSLLEGDCNDCNPDVSPAAAEIPNGDPGNPGTVPLDDDCNGVVHDAPEACDLDLALDSNDPMAAARAIDLCKVVADGAFYGVLSAQWRLPDSAEPPADKLEAFHVGHGLLPDLGPQASPQQGSRLLALSTGAARRPADPGFSSSFNKGYTSAHPAGLPFETPACGGVTTGAPHDGIALEVALKPPVNAVGFGFHFRFYTHDWGNACTTFNDQVAVLLSPPPPASIAGDVAFDQLGHPLTVSFLTPEACVCFGGCPEAPACEANAGLLAGSGFADKGAATGWLESLAPIEKGTDEVTLRFLAYDAFDGNSDTMVLLDAFRWLGAPVPL